MVNIERLFGRCAKLELDVVLGNRENEWHIGIGKRFGSLASYKYYEQGNSLQALVDDALEYLKLYEGGGYLGHCVAPRGDFLSSLR